MPLTAYPIDQSTPALAYADNISETPVFGTTTKHVCRYGSTLFAVLTSVDHDYVYVYKSTNNGQTWTQCDSGNRPNDGAAGHSLVFVDGQYLRIAYAHFVFTTLYESELRIKSFDMGAQAWVAGEITGGPSEDHNSALLQVRDGVYLGSGEYVVVYAKYTSPSATDHNLFYARYTAGAWTLDQSIDTGGTLFDNFRHAVSFLASDSRIHIAYYLGATLYHKSLDLTWSLSARSTVGTDYTGAWDMVERSGVLYFPILYRYSGAFPTRARPAILTATVGPASPSWSLTDHATEQVNVAGNRGTHKLLLDGSTIYSIWEPASTTIFNTDNIAYRKNTGSGWDAGATEFIDFADTSPFAPPYSVAEGYTVVNNLSPFYPIVDANTGHGFSLMLGVDVSGGPTAFSAACYITAAGICCCADFAY